MELKIRLENSLKKLKECQKEKQLNSCFNCKKLLQCEIRENYLKNVYKSMNKGKGGNFEF